MNFNATDNRVLELYSCACFSGEQNAAISYIIVHLTYIRGLIHGIGRGVPNGITGITNYRTVLKYQNAEVVRLITEDSKFLKIDRKSFFHQISALKIACMLYSSAFYTQ